MNLIPFALFSSKIPAVFLRPTKAKQHHFKNLFSLFSDCAITMMITMTLTQFFKVYAGFYIGTVSTKFAISFPAMMNFITYPLVTFAYFTICLVANDGLTLGTNYTKQRLAVKNEYKQALLLTLNALTLNLLYFKVKDLFRPKDYRYHELMEERFESIDLHTLIKEEEMIEEEYQIAA